MPVESVLMEIFVWWEAPVSMKVEWRCASMTNGGQCVMMTGAVLMPVWSASSWVMQPLEVSANTVCSVRARVSFEFATSSVIRWNSI